MAQRVVLITGCSSGIGRALAARLHRAGFTVVATARRGEDLADVPAATRLQLDVTSQASVDDAVAETVRRHGQIDVLVNNAGYGQRGAVEEVSNAETEAAYAVNVHGVLRMIRAVLPTMRQSGSGRIINVSSVAGKISLPLMGVYCSTKFALEALSDSLRVELGVFGIRVVVIEPGMIATRFSETAQTVSRRVLTNGDSPYAPLYQEGMNLTNRVKGRGARPDSVARVIERAIRAPRPKARYQAPASAVWMVRLLPAAHWVGFEYWLSRGLRKTLGQPRQGSVSQPGAPRD
ncbi:MAG: SDR family oxidoreductase [Thermaerobacter sp.]|nr:SDR family oxidoreductase [Thermaerobacter sp.]